MRIKGLYIFMCAGGFKKFVWLIAMKYESKLLGSNELIMKIPMKHA